MHSRQDFWPQGCDVIDCGVLPTPALQYIVKEHYEGGAMITASHNPPEYNGVKIIEPDGTEMGDEETIRLETLLSDQSIPVKPWDQVGKEVTARYLIDEYIHAIVSQFAGKPGKGMTVVVDPGPAQPARQHPQFCRHWDAGFSPLMGLWTGHFPDAYRSHLRKV